MIIFAGVAGSGKSLQGKKLADTLGLPWLSTGEFLRMLTSGQTRIDMVSGKLLEDGEIISLVQKILTVIDTKQEFILDGFPRTVAQADWLINQQKHGQLHITAVINMKADPEVVKSRLIKRGRPDDYDEAIKERFVEYEKSFAPIIEDFKNVSTPIIEIDAEQSVEEVHKAILSAVKAIKDENTSKN